MTASFIPRHCSPILIGWMAAFFLLSGCSMEGYSGGGKSPKIPLERKAGPVRLGMTVEEMAATTEVTEQTGSNPGLIEGERSFELKRTAVPEGIRSIGLRFLDDRLYRITVDFFPNHYNDESWAALVEEKTRRYGKGWAQKMRMSKYPTELITWEDKETRLVLRREVRLKFGKETTENQHNVMMVLLDMPTWNERSDMGAGL